MLPRWVAYFFMLWCGVSLFVARGLVDCGGTFRRRTASFIGVWAGGANLVARAVRIGVGGAVHREEAVDLRLVERSGCPARYECYFHDFLHRVKGSQEFLPAETFQFLILAFDSEGTFPHF